MAKKPPSASAKEPEQALEKSEALPGEIVDVRKTQPNFLGIIEDVENVADLFSGMQIESPMVLELGQALKAEFVGAGPPVGFVGDDGKVQNLNVWLFNARNARVSLLGSCILDRELGKIENYYELPVAVTVFRQGTRQIKGGLRQLTVYQVGADMGAVRRPVPLKPEPPF